MKRFFNFFIIIVSLTQFSSCFEILEEIKLNADGSGEMLVTFNLSKSKSKIASIMLLDSVNGYKVPSKEDIGLALKEAKSHLKTIEGISNIKTTSDFDNYIFTISCDFSSTANLDAVFKDLISKHNKKSKTNFNTTNFSYSANSFKRTFSYDESVKRSFYKLKSEDREIFDDANYTSIYRFENDVEQVSNSNAKVSPNKKAVFLKVDLMSLILGEKNITNSIQLSK
ncbi:hypothetical protein [Winogradskyella sp. 4-2091]|uniref:hypothetical protein n=1 Tax=Winogradskyella sp. 4-2091 TaxID=3381659 RepID=UPI0038919FA2